MNSRRLIRSPRRRARGRRDREFERLFSLKNDYQVGGQASCIEQRDELASPDVEHWGFLPSGSATNQFTLDAVAGPGGHGSAYDAWMCDAHPYVAADGRRAR